MADEGDGAVVGGVGGVGERCDVLVEPVGGVRDGLVVVEGWLSEGGEGGKHFFVGGG